MGENPISPHHFEGNMDRADEIAAQLEAMQQEDYRDKDTADRMNCLLLKIGNLIPNYTVNGKKK